MTPLPISKVRDDLYRLLGMEEPINAPDFVADIAANAINAALQNIFSETGNLFTATQTTILVFGGANNSTNAKSFQIDPGTKIVRVLLNDRPLRSVARRQEIDSYKETYSPNAQNGMPEAYYLERTYSSGTPGAILHIMPGATEGTAITITIETTIPVPRITADELEDDSIILPIPHDWAETFLIPLARGHAMRSHYWIMKDEAALYSADFDRAMASLKGLNPRPAEDQDTTTDPEERRSA